MKNSFDNDGGIEGRIGMPDKDTLLGNMIEKSIQSSGTVFTAEGKEHTRNVIRLFVMQPQNQIFWERSNGEYSALSDYINQKVKDFAATSGIFNQNSSASQYA